MTVSVQYDAWLSDHIGRPAYTLVGDLAQATHSHLPRKRCFICAKTPVEDLASARRLNDLGFNKIEKLVTLERAPSPMAHATGSARFAREQDVDDVTALAGRAFQLDRFRSDSELGPAIASRLKQEWAANFFSGKRGDWMVVTENQDRVIGFLLLFRDTNGLIVIDLIACADEHRGKGLARDMIRFAAKQCAGDRLGFKVGTQQTNTPALKLYESLGFHRTLEKYTFHKHQKSGLT